MGWLMSRTPEQIAADDGVTKAIEEWLRAYHFDGSDDNDGIPRVLTDYVILMATQGWDSDGEAMTGYPYCLRDSALPHYRSLGLIQIGLELIASSMNEEDR
jgi:hypothetical protein